MMYTLFISCLKRIIIGYISIIGLHILILHKNIPKIHYFVYLKFREH